MKYKFVVDNDNLLRKIYLQYMIDLMYKKRWNSKTLKLKKIYTDLQDKYLQENRKIIESYIDYETNINIDPLKEFLKENFNNLFIKYNVTLQDISIKIEVKLIRGYYDQSRIYVNSNNYNI